MQPEYADPESPMTSLHNTTLYHRYANVEQLTRLLSRWPIFGEGRADFTVIPTGGAVPVLSVRAVVGESETEGERVRLLGAGSN